MDNEKTETKYFINNFSTQIQNLFHSDPKKFKTLYRAKLVKIVKRDLFQMVQFVTPVYEIIYCSDWYDSWKEDVFWYNIKNDKQTEAKQLFNIYCHTDTSDKTKIEVKNKSFFNLLRMIYFYVNYRNKEKREMSGIATWNTSVHDRRPEIYIGDFIKYDYSLKRNKIQKTKSELGKQIDEECARIADKFIDAEIKRISDINKQIQDAKATLAKYGTELIRGY